MNWKRLILLSGVALAVIAVPVADAQRNGAQRGEARVSGGSGIRAAAATRGSARSFEGRRGNWRGGDNRGNRWSNNRHRGHRHHHHFRPRFYGGFGGFGSPYGYGYPGYGYGYPYYGASAQLYYNGYNPGRVYEGRSAGNSGGSLIAQMQQELASGGYYRGAIDGVIGNGTRSAIRAYERDNGLRVDGRVDQQLLARMGLS